MVVKFRSGGINFIGTKIFAYIFPFRDLLRIEFETEIELLSIILGLISFTNTQMNMIM